MGPSDAPPRRQTIARAAVRRGGRAIMADELIRLGRRGRVPASEIAVAVYGGGSFGTAMACVLARKGIRATLVVRRPDVVEAINTHHVNPYYQSDLKLPGERPPPPPPPPPARARASRRLWPFRVTPSAHRRGLARADLVTATLDAEVAFRDADYIFHAVPVQASRAALESVRHLIRPDVPVVSLAKGIETSTLCVMSELLPQVLGPEQKLAFLSGPSFAAEIVNGMATAVVVASEDRDLAKELMGLFTSASFRALWTKARAAPAPRARAPACRARARVPRPRAAPAPPTAHATSPPRARRTSSASRWAAR
jgi:predicted dinucleotide-binding enzyme